jgi:hypothetical protein
LVGVAIFTALIVLSYLLIRPRVKIPTRS